MPNPEGTVFVIDDDQDMRQSLKWLIESKGLAVELFASAEQFLRTQLPDAPACLVLDVRMPGMSGMELLEHMRGQGSHLPIILLTGHGDVPLAVQALKNGAMHFLEKPADHEAILSAVSEAIELNKKLRSEASERIAIEKIMSRLSKRQEEILHKIISGQANKTIAYELEISERTVEKHREIIMQKTGARSLAALTRMVVMYELGRSTHDRPNSEDDGRP